MLPLRSPTLPPATHTNCFLVGDSEAVLVEPASPYPEEIDRVVELVEARRAAGGEVVAILATHHHIDHIGGAVALKERLGLPLFGHALTAERLRGLVPFDRLLEHGERIALGAPGEMVLEAVHTPGHAPGHLCFVDTRSGAMIAGDMVAGVGTILIEPTDGDMAVYLESLRAIADREPSMLLPAHGGPIHAVAAKVEQYVSHRLMREHKVFEALRSLGERGAEDDWCSPGELVPVAYDDAPPAVHPIAALATEAHLIKLEGDGRVTSAGGRWRVAAP
ncbi:MAG: MBL fold metallo-hydrolase [Deltaproteobacteria bacterium]|nr:MBL fold metallo-hydrolase [Deltaproteobacteria bacterium]